MDSSEGTVQMIRVPRKELMVAGQGILVGYDPSMLGDCVRVQRRALGLDQPALTAKLNASPSATRNYSLPWLSRLENGAIRRALSDAVLATLAEALCIDVEMLRRGYYGDVRKKVSTASLLPLHAQGLHIKHPFIEAMFCGSGIVGILTTTHESERQVINGVNVVVLAPAEDPEEEIVLLAPPGQDAAIEKFRSSFDQLIDLLSKKTF